MEYILTSVGISKYYKAIRGAVVHELNRLLVWPHWAPLQKQTSHIIALSLQFTTSIIIQRPAINKCTVLLPKQFGAIVMAMFLQLQYGVITMWLGFWITYMIATVSHHELVAYK